MTFEHNSLFLYNPRACILDYMSCSLFFFSFCLRLQVTNRYISHTHTHSHTSRARGTAWGNGVHVWFGWVWFGWVGLTECGGQQRQKCAHTDHTDYTEKGKNDHLHHLVRRCLGSLFVDVDVVFFVLLLTLIPVYLCFSVSFSFMCFLVCVCVCASITAPCTNHTPGLISLSLSFLISTVWSSSRPPAPCTLP